MREWKTSAEITDSNGNTGTANITVCAETDVAAGVAAAELANANGYQVADGRVDVALNGTCQH
ncbi:hypothetical protein [Streptomyces scabiei]|uniref:hypothetical protein n=1 Tax=Streptomyces scabiei TaxID=1930 RepID=UPI0004E6CBE9|nr:hypothetical protein [Streptomyces scabiei]KFG05588.1 hypothetical protein IQ61_29305 [Streptomyces scabiei]MDX2829463.1 hypothetical protein [Streptomyces scabiei]MDX3279111.1 hypothetical protein [Streptomyces scabiei]MDX3674981.1 hypothetical protein [Streptomyces scabiei]